MFNQNKESEMIQTLPALSNTAGLLDSPPTTTTTYASVFNKVSRKSTNRSKSASRWQRCYYCHDNPVCSKTKNKVKETCKIKNGSGGVGSDLRLVSKQVVNSSPGLHYSGILDDVGKKEEGVVDENRPGLIGDLETGSFVVDENGAGLIGDSETGSDVDKDNDDKISFCDVVLVLEDVDEDEGWVKL